MKINCLVVDLQNQKIVKNQKIILFVDLKNKKFNFMKELGKKHANISSKYERIKSKK